MKCKTIKDFVNGKPIWRDKVKYLTLEEANIEADKINKQKTIFIKRVVYKCSICSFFHIGRTKEMLEKPVPKRPQFLGVRHMKVVGFVDLAQFNHLSPEALAEKKALKKQLIEENRRKNNEQIRLRQKIKRERKANAAYEILHSGKIAGHMLQLSNGDWKYYLKKKIVKVITDDGVVRHIKFTKVWPEDKIEFYHQTGRLPIRKLTQYIVENEIRLK